MRRRRDVRGSWRGKEISGLERTVDWVCLRKVVCGGGLSLEAEGSEMIDGIKRLSFWKRDRFATRRRLKGVLESEPSRIGWMKRGQSREQILRKERRSLPECLDKES